MANGNASSKPIPKAMTIAGSDSGGGAGIQADLKTFQELGVFGTSAITALTAQNTLGVQGVYPIPLDAIGQQIDSVLSDIGADAVKTGMLFSADIIALVADKLKRYGPMPVVVDPVMIAKGGAPLLQAEAVEALRRELLPIAAVLTPNVPEACAILGIDRIDDVDGMIEAARRLHALGPKRVFLKGGHLDGDEAVDVLFDGTEAALFRSPRIRTKHTHGTGCTTASAIAAGLAKGLPADEAVAEAKRFITAAIGAALPIGGGIGPTNHAALRLQAAPVRP
ncbi:bifunctional hydroxymethylpyrimidine kinase/phosphomethylpyrimidine kinase [Paenibacillus flagellatus]|uniref:Hydroxymethylpyrimidine/phosphomethylpyrimidine kinase n=1 Tax=Paenibacillus flagellatus TaxID=2211139 RepID=A0A2V5K748_9BACL|nr:bifunctional hydroxymethylpyrimidine kinase/phosphomethylpyrimidine kinase [Paenibacillus flagellatus]PYI55261.1 bifunctional hydroxymethylpyrimidine kinase/phosphomethylpyrimidine kinase [Paenibacillus flagellatus]